MADEHEIKNEEAEASVAEPVEAEAAPADEPAAEQVPEGEPVAEATAQEEAAAADLAGGVPSAGADAPAATAPSEPKRKKKRLARPLRQRTKTRRAAAADGAGERKPVVRLPKPERERGRRQERRGIVVSSAMEKTIVVKVDTIKAHRRYKKVVRRSQKFHAHDEENRANVGDVVRIVETRPLSKLKNWRLAEVVEEAR